MLRIRKEKLLIKKTLIANLFHVACLRKNAFQDKQGKSLALSLCN